MTGLAMYIRVRELPVINAVLKHYGYAPVNKQEDRYLGNIISARNIKGYTVQQALVDAVREHRKLQNRL